MRKFAVLLLSACCAATIAGAAQAEVDPKFKGPGWYAVWYMYDSDGTIEGSGIVDGPFPDEDSCTPTLEPDIPAFHSDCEFLDSAELK